MGMVVSMASVLDLVTASAAETARVAQALGCVACEGDAILLVGGLGAGKTQFTKGLAEGLGVRSSIVSPTFNISMLHDSGRLPLIHFDLYRLEDASQLEDVDFYASSDELSGCVCVVEWADMFPDDMPDDALSIRLESVGGGSQLERSIIAESSGPRSQRLLSDWADALKLQ